MIKSLRNREIPMPKSGAKAGGRGKHRYISSAEQMWIFRGAGREFSSLYLNSGFCQA
jgi:hypothetical protein